MVGLRRMVIESAIQCFKENIDTHDSLFLVTEETGWIWKEGAPVNYDSQTKWASKVSRCVLLQGNDGTLHYPEGRSTANRM